MSLGNKLQNLYPNANPPFDYRVEDNADGLGPRLVFWNTEKLGPIPDKSAIDAASSGPPVDPDKASLAAYIAKLDAGTATAADDQQAIRRLIRRIYKREFGG